MQLRRLLLAIVMMLGCAAAGPGCAARQRETAPIERQATSLERPAKPLSEEESLADRIGEVGIVVLVVVVTVGGILLPILLLNN